RRRDEEDEDEGRPRRRSLEIGPELPWWEEYRVALLIGGACLVLLAVGLVVLLLINDSKEPAGQQPQAAVFPPPPPAGFQPDGNLPGMQPMRPAPALGEASLDDLLAQLGNRGSAPWNRAQVLQELGRRKDQRALPNIVALLGDFFDGNHAANALRLYGP